MNLAQRYIFRIAAYAFVSGLLALTAVIWLTQALREVDLMTSKGQSALVFLSITGLTIPSLLMLIAPFALFGGALYALSRLNGDSELIVMSAAGLSPTQLLRPFMMLAVVVSMIVATLSLWLMPASFREIRDLVTLIRSDFLARVVREGSFTTLDAGLTFHYRERGPHGELMGVFIQDRRDPERPSTYLAEQGVTAEIDGRNYLVLDKGSVQRRQPNARDTAIVAFDRYAIDLSQFGGKGEESYKPRERSTLALLNPDSDDKLYQVFPGRFRAELHDRFANPIWAFVAALIAFAALGQARTTRQGRGLAVATAVLAFGAARLIGVWATTMAVRSAFATPLIYIVPLAACAIAAAAIFAPQATQRPFERLGEMLARRRAAAGGASA